MHAVLSEGTPDKPTGSSGSFGIGHLTAFALSDLNYIIYLGKTHKKTIFSGQAILASHIDKNNDNRSPNGFLVEDIKSDDYEFYGEKYLPSWLKNIHKKILTTGSSVVILGFNFFNHQTKPNEWDLLIKEAVIKNFAIAIKAGKLKVSIFKNETIDKDSLDKILGELLDREISKASSKEIEKVEQNIKTFSDHDVRGTLSNEGYPDCTIMLRNDVNNHCVTFWRNGMLITRKHNDFKKPHFAHNKLFDAIVLLDGTQKDHKSHDLVRKAETPMHDDFIKNRLEKTDQKKLTAFIVCLRKWLEKKAEKIDYDALPLADLMVIGGKSGGFKKTKYLSPRPEPQAWPNPQPFPDPTPPNPDPPLPNPDPPLPPRPKVRRNPRFPFKHQSKLFEKSLVVNILPLEDMECCHFQFSIDTGWDPSCVSNDVQSSALKIISIIGINAKLVEDNIVSLNNVKENERRRIEIMFDGTISQSIIDKCLSVTEVSILNA